MGGRWRLVGALLAATVVAAQPGRDAGPRLLAADAADATAMPFVGGDTLLLVGTMDGNLHAIEGASGSVLWTRDTGGKLVSSSFLAHLQAEATDAAQDKNAPEAKIV